MVTVTTESISSTDVHLKFSVKDEGIGIAESAKSCIFQPFSQADSSVTRRQECYVVLAIVTLQVWRQRTWVVYFKTTHRTRDNGLRVRRRTRINVSFYNTVVTW